MEQANAATRCAIHGLRLRHRKNVAQPNHASLRRSLRSLLGPRQNALIRAFCSDTLGSSLARFTQRRALQTLYEIKR